MTTKKLLVFSAIMAVALGMTSHADAKKKPKMSKYLFAYFTGNAPKEEQVCYAVSDDGFNYTPINDGNPIIGSDSIALAKGVRDPHLLRGEDGSYYMVLTDMRSSLGWTSNRGLILLRSNDLIHWTHHGAFPRKIQKHALCQRYTCMGTTNHLRQECWKVYGVLFATHQRWFHSIRQSLLLLRQQRFY